MFFAMRLECTFIVDRLGQAGIDEGHQPVIGAEDVQESGGQSCVVVLAHLGQHLYHLQVIAEDQLHKENVAGLSREVEVA